ncbi:GATA zinc finger domain-containing protein 14-like isoform X2 [Daktulosphaira vitifoliae]|uniref:GATA zinc finger domain-containing protein 14-like isoform X2 n=1 Tax=Daktulosphaira vitifoliae TaxID=58002 RepID=UPI0021A9A4D2|nr:GATA zinc finger domain-containing protein 14-like isoform X2 [Daktulosphaira vitifoliae]
MMAMDQINSESLFSSSGPSTSPRPGGHHHGHGVHMHYNGNRESENYFGNGGHMNYNGHREDDYYHGNRSHIHHHGNSDHVHHNVNGENNNHHGNGGHIQNHGHSSDTYHNGNREDNNYYGNGDRGNNYGNREHENNWNNENINTNNGYGSNSESFITSPRPSISSGHYHGHGGNIHYNGNREEKNHGNGDYGNNWNGENTNMNNGFGSNSESFHMSLRPTSSLRPFTSLRPNWNQNENNFYGDHPGNRENKNNYTDRNNSNGSNWNNENINANNGFEKNDGRLYSSPKPTSFSKPESINHESYLSSKLPTESSCGLINATLNDRIVDGSPAELGDWPWIAALGYVSTNNPEKIPQWLCGGTLISDKYVVTAAHCTVGIGKRKISVARLGDLDLNPDVNDRANPIDAPVDKVITHKKYNSQDYTNDIALIKLQRSISFNSGPSSTALLKAPVPIVDIDDCKRSYANKKTVIDERTLCAGYKTGKIDACQGDSGGPLMWSHNLKYYLIGVVSFGFKCADPDFPGVYSRVTYFVDWIVKTMDKN